MYFADCFETDLLMLGMSQGFEQDQARDTVAICRDVTDDFPGIDLSRNAIEGLVGTLLRKVRASPIEELHECQSKCFISFTGAVFIGIQVCEQLGESRFGQRPFFLGN